MKTLVAIALGVALTVGSAHAQGQGDKPDLGKQLADVIDARSKDLERIAKLEAALTATQKAIPPKPEKLAAQERRDTLTKSCKAAGLKFDSVDIDGTTGKFTIHCK